MGSPVVESDIQPLSEQADVCAKLNSVFLLVSQFKSFLGWLLDSSGEISDAVVTSVQDRLTPIGSIIMWPSSTLPSSRWLICNGQAISRTTYATLFTRIGTLWGSTSSSDFKVPDFQERSPIGVGAAYNLGTQYGSATATVPMLDHTHYFGALAENNDDVYLMTLSANLTPGPAFNMIKVSGNDSSGNPASSFMSNQSVRGLLTDNPIESSIEANVTVSVVHPSTAVYFIIKAL